MAEPPGGRIESGADPLIAFPERASKLPAVPKGGMIYQLGWLYMGFGFFCAVFLLYMAFTRRGDIKLVYKSGSI